MNASKYNVTLLFQRPCPGSLHALETFPFTKATLRTAKTRPLVCLPLVLDPLRLNSHWIPVAFDELMHLGNELCILTCHSNTPPMFGSNITIVQLDIFQKYTASPSRMTPHSHSSRE